MFLHSYCASKSNLECCFVLKRNVRKHFLSCLDLVFGLAVYINSEILESDWFSFIKLYSSNPNPTIFNKIFYILAFKANLWHDILQMNLGE